MNEKISIQFLGGVGTVTGSKYLIKAHGTTLMIDCGLFQGIKTLRKKNWEALPFDAKTINFVLLTHGHLDHVGYLPRLVEKGFNGPILATPPTLQIAKIILEDSAKLQEEEAEHVNSLKYSKHQPALPLYTTKDVEKTIKLFNQKKLNDWHNLTDRIRVRFRYNGHILGATFIELKIDDKLFVFSGDIGRPEDFLLYAPEKPEQADILFIESTYGDRIHPKGAKEKLIDIIQKSFGEGRTIIIPSFAVERAQVLMYLLWQFSKQKLISDIPVYLDTPMGKNVLDIFNNNSDTEWHKLTNEECFEMCKNIKIIQSKEESVALSEKGFSKIIIAGSGMASGGRVLTHLQRYLPNPKATIILVGYQAAGTRGRQLLEGAHEIKIYGKYYPVNAMIENLEGLSAHADQKELIDWLSHINAMPKKIFITHGEPHSADAFRVKLKTQLGWYGEIPTMYETVDV